MCFSLAQKGMQGVMTKEKKLRNKLSFGKLEVLFLFYSLIGKLNYHKIPSTAEY